MKVLIIDDDKFIRTLLAAELQQENIVVELAGDGEEGLAKALDSAPDVIILDLILPKKDGFALLEELRGSKKLLGVRIVIFTTLTQEHDRAEALTLGASAYFKKGEHTVHHVVEAAKGLLAPAVRS